MGIQILLVTLMRMWIRILAANLEKVLKLAHIPYMLACHQQCDVNLDSAYHFDADPDSTFPFDADHAEPDPDPQH